MTDHNEIQKRTLSIKRTFDAPIELVWEAWTQPEHIAQWWGAKGMETRIIEHHFQVGGHWKYAMTMPGGQEFLADGTYIEIVEPFKIISSANFKPMTEGVEIQAFFEKNGDKTDFIFNCVHPSEAYCKQQEEMGFYNGWGSVFERLDQHLQAASV